MNNQILMQNSVYCEYCKISPPTSLLYNNKYIHRFYKSNYQILSELYSQN